MTLSLERQAFTVEPLSPVLGASIVGLDLREPLSEITKRAVISTRHASRGCCSGLVCVGLRPHDLASPRRAELIPCPELNSVACPQRHAARIIRT